MDIVEISDRWIDPPGLLEGAVEGLELAGRAHLVDCVVHGRDCGKGSIDGNGVRRQADAAPIGELLELGGNRGEIDDDCLLPFVKPIGEDEMAATLAAVDDAIGIVLDRRDVAPT